MADPTDRRQHVSTTKSPNHFVLAYSHATLLRQAAETWCAASLEEGASVVAAVTREHAFALRCMLARRGFPVVELEAEGRLLLLDAEAAVAQMLKEGRPVRRRFDGMMLPVLREAREASRSGSVRVWGELSDLLRQTGNGDAAALVEHFWNGAVAATRCRVMCSHGLDVFRPQDYPSLRHVSEGHDLVVAAHDEARMEAAISMVIDDAFGLGSRFGWAALGGDSAPLELPTGVRHLMAIKKLMPYFGAKLVVQAGIAYENLAEDVRIPRSPSFAGAA